MVLVIVFESAINAPMLVVGQDDMQILKHSTVQEKIMIIPNGFMGENGDCLELPVGTSMKRKGVKRVTQKDLSREVQFVNVV